MVSQLSNAASEVTKPRLSLVFEKGEDSLSVVEFSVHERMNAPFEVTIMARSPNADINLEDITGYSAGFGFRSLDMETVAWTGVCSYMEQVQAEVSTTNLSTYHFIIVPPIWLLTQRRGQRIFQHLTVPDIVKKILAEYRIDAKWELDDAYSKHEFEVQYDETDFAFVSRLLEGAGISYWFEKVAAGTKAETKLTFTDHPQKAPSIGEIDFYDQPNRNRNKKFVTNVRIGHDVKPGKTTWRDYDFRKPQLELMKSSSLSLPGDEAVELGYERYHFAQGVSLVEVSADGSTPVADEHGAARNDPGELQSKATRSAEAERHAKRYVEFDTNEKEIVPGKVFSIAQHPHDDIAPDKKLLVVETIIRGDIRDWSLVGAAVFAEPGWRYRPALRTKKPRVMGYQTAIVVGPPGKEIHTDEFGRVRVRFHWDRENDFDDFASCWLRVSQQWAGAGFGWMLVPRIGQEVIVDFFGGDPNQPVVIGRVHNMTAGVPRVLPKHMTQSTWRSATSPYTDAWFNEIMMDDEQGKELVFVQAQRDLYKLVKHSETERTGNTRTIVVGAARVTAIASHETQQVGKQHLVKVVSAGDLHIPDMGDPDVTPKTTMMETVDGRITLTTGNATVTLDGADIGIDAQGALRFSADGMLIMKASDIYLNEEDAAVAKHKADKRVSDPVDKPDRILPAVAKLSEPPQKEEIDQRKDVEVDIPIEDTPGGAPGGKKKLPVASQPTPEQLKFGDEIPEDKLCGGRLDEELDKAKDEVKHYAWFKPDSGSSYTLATAALTVPQDDGSKKTAIVWACSKTLSKGKHTPAFAGPTPSDTNLAVSGGDGTKTLEDAEPDGPDSPAFFVLGRGGKGSQTMTASDVPNHTYALNKAAPYCSHCEARMLDTVFAELGGQVPKGSSITINVHWKNSKGISKEACSHCQQIIAAAEKAGLKVTLCPDPKAK
jgi:type VI secretion system secreted protein VgrG